MLTAINSIEKVVIADSGMITSLNVSTAVWTSAGAHRVTATGHIHRDLLGLRVAVEVEDFGR
jgi:hypothetical protein